MRVAMVSVRYLPSMGGVERHVHEVGRRLAARGVDVSILTTDLRGGLHPVESIEGMLVRRFGAWPHWDGLHIAPGLLRALHRDPYDLVHVQGVHDLLPPIALAIAQQRGLPTALTFHTGGNSNPLRTAVRNAQWSAQRHILRRTNKLIAVCDFEAQLFGRYLGGHVSSIAMIRNGADPLPVADRSPVMAGDPLVLSIGRLERYKGHDRAILAMPDLLRAAPGARLGIVGSGPYDAALRRLVAQLGLGDHVSFAAFGPGQRAELGALVASADAVVLLSDYEANPIAVMEALALGVDVLVADTSGLSELGPAGLATVLARDASPSQTASAILATTRARRWAAGPPTLPTWDGCTDELLGVYDELLDGGQAHRALLPDSEPEHGGP